MSTCQQKKEIQYGGAENEPIAWWVWLLIALGICFCLSSSLVIFAIMSGDNTGGAGYGSG